MAKPSQTKLVQEQIKLARSGSRSALARLLTWVENREEKLSEVIKQIFKHTGRAHVVGVTGPPGAGKSTLIDATVKTLRAEGKRVAVVAVDPSSPFSGGAVLGDRVRMQRHALDEGVYIRSLGTRGKHGGLSHSAKEVVFVLDAVGFDVILVETAGVGQTELEIMKLAQTVAVVLVPESGDAVQVMKAGLMEIADIFVLNKSDRPEAERLLKELLSYVEEGSQKTAVVQTQAHREIGLGDFVAALGRHLEYLKTSGVITDKRRLLLRNELVDILTEKVSNRLDEYLDSKSGVGLIDRLVQKVIDPYTAASKVRLK